MKNNILESHLEDANDKNKSDDEVFSILEKTYGIASSLDDSRYKTKIFNELSKAYFKIGKVEKSRKMDDKILELSMSLNDSLGIAKAYNNIGVNYRSIQIDSAYKNFYKADKIYTDFDKNKKYDYSEYAYDHGKTLIDLAKLSLKVKDYTRSEDLAIKAIEKFKVSENKSYLPLCYTTLGTIAKYLEQYENAVDYHLTAIDYAKNTERESLYAVIGNNNIGTVYKSQGNYQKATEFYQRALSNYEYLEKNPKRYALLLDNLAYVNFLSNDLREIPKTFYYTLRIRDSIDDKYGITTNTLHLAEYYKTQQNDSLANYYAAKANVIAQEMDYNEELLQSYQLLSEVSPPDEGLLYAQKYITLNDSLIKEERTFRDKFARIRFETEQKEEKIVEISKKNQFLVIITLALTLLSLLGYIIFRQRQRNKELEFSQTQQETNEEIYRLLLTQQAKLEEGRKLEQNRMSEELHDGVLGRLFGVRLSLDGINQRASDGFTDSRNKYIEELKSIEKEIRLISHDLGSDTLSKDVAYVDVVESLINDLCSVHKVQFDFDSNEDINWEAVDDPKKVNLFRIIQESLQNIFKHAKADHVKIDFDYQDGEIKLTIEDNGVGFNKEKVKRGIGLKNITSRVKQMNGSVDFDSVIGEGAKVFVGIPVSDLVIAKKKKPKFSIAPG